MIVVPQRVNPQTMGPSPYTSEWAEDPTGNNGAAFVDGGSVTTWRTVSNAGQNSPTNGTAANRPVWRQSVTALNGRSGVEFDGTNDVLFRDIGDHVAPRFVVLIAASRNGANSTAEVGVSLGSNSTNNGLGKNTANQFWGNNNGTGAAGGTVDTKPHLWYMDGRNTTGKLIVDEGNAVNLTGQSMGTDNENWIWVGAAGTWFGSADKYWNGWIHFAATYDSDPRASTSWEAILVTARQCGVVC